MFIYRGYGIRWLVLIVGFVISNTVTAPTSWSE